MPTHLSTDTDNIHNLVERYDDLAQQANKIRDNQREIAALIDKARLARKPSFPTHEHVFGIREALQIIKAGTAPESHLGDSVNASVRVRGDSGWMSIEHHSPYSAISGHKLWGFNQDDIHLLLEVIRQAGVEVLTWWSHDGGISIMVPRKQA